MSTAVAELMLAQGALLNGSWWVARSLRASDGRSWTWLIWACLGLAVVGLGFDLAFAVPGGPAGGAVTTGLILLLDAACLLVVAARATRAWPARGQLERARRARESGDPAAAADAYHRAAVNLGSAWQRVQELEALAREGRMRLEAGEAQAAIETFTAVIARARALRDTHAEARALRWIGDAGFELGDRQAARRAYWDAVNAGQAMGSAIVVGRGLARLAWLEHVAGDGDLAREYFAWAARLDVGEADLRLTSSLMLLAACFRMAEGRLETARPATEDSIRLSAQAGDGAQEAAGRLVLGCVQYLEGLYESGGQMIEEASNAELPVQSRRVAGLLSAGMSFVARGLRRTGDATGFAALAARLLAGHPILASVAAQAGDPNATAVGEGLRVERLVHVVAAPDPALAGAAR